LSDEVFVCCSGVSEDFGLLRFELWEPLTQRHVVIFQKPNSQRIETSIKFSKKKISSYCIVTSNNLSRNNQHFTNKYWLFSQ